jgi:hypothetical protein
MIWLKLSWWKYLFAEKAEDISWPKVIKCRYHGHKGYGVNWYNTSSYEPDMHCKNCGDDLG